ncbi:MAG: carbohydrate ABC transporter permease [Candidatus Acetothermia bacterium]|jgi:ABC-type glycerol-3-phosphate transport system permease component|nr:carbohydrate ABC transporter permease [Candidatus Acetothermia bacterium]
MTKLKAWAPYLVMYAMAFLWVIPTLWVAETAFKPNPDIFSIPPKWVPSRLTTAHIAQLFASWPFGRWLLNSLILASLVTAGSLFVSTLAAFSFARLQWRGRDAAFLTILVFMLLPMEVSVIPLYFMMIRFRLLNTIYGAALPMIALPIGVFLLRQFFLNIPRDLDDAARIDGCSSLGVLIRVIIPNAIPVFAAYGMYIFNYAWNEFFWSLICLRSPQKVTLPVGLRLIQGAFEINYGLITSAAFMASLPSLIVFLILRQRIIRGIALSSGIKG